MRFFTALLGFLLVISLSQANVVQRRTYRNAEEILVPVTIIQDGEEVKEALLEDLKENETVPQIKLPEEKVLANDIATAVDEEEKLKAVEEVVEAQRRLDEAIVEEEIKEAIEEEQEKEIVKAVEEENKLRNSLPEVPQIVSVAQPEIVVEPVKEIIEEVQKASELKAVSVEKQTPNQIVVVVETNNEEQPEGAVRQATQATPTQSTTQQNFVQQLIQNSPLGQFFNQITGQNGQTQTSQVANDEVAPPAPAPTLPGLFNPVTAVQTAAQSVVNSTTQAFQGLQQFASNLGNQFQSTLSGLGGQQQEQAASDATTARPPGPIQQLLNTFTGQQAQPAPAQQGPLQGLLNIFQGNNRPQANAAITNPTTQTAAIQPVKETEIQQDSQSGIEADAAISTPDQISNEVRESGEVNDSLEDTVQPEELIVVNDDATQGENEQEQEQVVSVNGTK